MNETPKPSNSLFKVGDKVIVIAEHYGHDFPIGEELEIIEVSDSDPDYLAIREGGTDTWYVCDVELKLKE